MTTLDDLLDRAVSDGALLASARENIAAMLARSTNPLYRASIEELAQAGNWQELNDRFFRTLAFGTGGLRGKTISNTVTSVEAGNPQPLGRPEHPCVGTNAMNTYNVSRATQGLANYLLKLFAAEGRCGRPSVCISYDTRFFSREFANLIARVLTEKGCDALLFESPRSTPELSFAVRMHGATAGINVTASHNPPPYNGYKVYFSDGAQIVEPHATGIINEVNAVASEEFEPVPQDQRGQIRMLGKETDEAYMARLETLLLDPELVRRENSLKIVYTPLHGVGAVIIKPMLDRLGFQASVVAEQEKPDGRFPTVKSPNPEVHEALAMGIEQAKKEGAHLVIATDPDDDRMGVAVKTASGEFEMLTGNQIGSLMAWYRIKRALELGILNEGNRHRGVLIKTLVTTDLQKVIAEKNGLSCVETLTGFKYIGEKLGKYEKAIPEELRRDYFNLSEEETRRLRLEHSKYYIFGGEESYGYSGSDFVRDKDGNSAVVMIAEVAAYAKSRGLTLADLLDEIYAEYGVYLERGESLVYDGAEGAAKIRKLVESYAANPPSEVAGIRVTGMRNFATEDIYDSEGDLLPKEAMIMLDLEGGGRVAVRPSGTEPKIKYYMFAVEPAAADVAEARKRAAARLEKMWQWLRADAEQRSR